MAVFFLLLLFRLSLSEHSVDIDKHMQYDCNTTCLLHSALPVCGSDKITYNDECSLKAEACASGKPLIVVHEGECKCEVICEDTYSHVCASNGKTFHNLCFLQKEACQSGKHLDVHSHPLDEEECKIIVSGECEIPWVKLDTGCYLFKDQPMKWYTARK